MNVLIVGAGAVGQVYGRHLVAGGAQVTFYVREKYLDEVRQGFTMYDLNRSKEPVRFEGAPAIATLDEVRAGQWDQVWMCISTTALYGDWLGPFLQATGDATIVVFQPGLRVGQLLSPHLPPSRIANGVIAFSSWHAPLPGSTRPQPGTAYWLPPMATNLFEGPGSAEIVVTLKRGGLSAKRGDAEAQTTRGSSILLTLVAALECAGWSFAGVRASPWSQLAADAGKQALAISCAYADIAPGPAGMVASPLVEGMLTRLAPVIAPFDIERFFQVHFTKVGGQTEVALDGWIEEGARQGLPTDRIETLRAELRKVRGTQG